MGLILDHINAINYRYHHSNPFIVVNEDLILILIIENYFKCLSRRSKSVFGKMNLDSNGKIDFSSAGDL